MPVKTPAKRTKAAVAKKRPGTKSPASKKPAATKAAAKKPAAKKSAAKAAPKKSTAKAAPKKSAAKKSVAKVAPKKSAAKKSVAKAAPKQSAAKKSVAKAAPKQSAVNKSAKKSAAKAAPKKSVVKQAAPKKSAAGSAPQTVSPSHSIAADFASAYKLPQLALRVGPATEDEVRLQVAIPDAQLIAEGADVATTRISLDCARMYGQALDVLTQATPKAKKALLGVTATLLRVAIFAAQHGDELYAERSQTLTTQKMRQTARKDSTAVAVQRGLAQRDQLRAVYLSVTGDEPTWRGRIVTAYGTAKDAADLAKALGQLVELGAVLVASTDSALCLRREGSGLTQELLTQVRSLAEEIALLGPAGQAARELSAVSQAEVDLWDGINLVLLERVMNLVNAAHEIEPSIPRLVPLSLRTYFSPKSGKRVAAPTAPNASSGSGASPT